MSIIVAAVIFLFARWISPSIAGSNTFLRGLAQAIYPMAWVFTVPFLVVAGASGFIGYRRRELLDSGTDLESLRGLSWLDFERLVGEAYRRQGYIVEEVGGSAPDGGIDLLLHRQGTKTIVQCKRWKTAQVGVSSIREFFGVTVSEPSGEPTQGTSSRDVVAIRDAMAHAMRKERLGESAGRSQGNAGLIVRAGR